MAGIKKFSYCDSGMGCDPPKGRTMVGRNFRQSTISDTFFKIAVLN